MWVVSMHKLFIMWVVSMHKLFIMWVVSMHKLFIMWVHQFEVCACKPTSIKCVSKKIQVSRSQGSDQESDNLISC